MIAAGVLAFREGLEAALVIGIVLGILRQIGRSSYGRMVWLGAAVAGLVSLTAGLGLQALGIAFEGPAEAIFEGLAMLAAGGVLTWMIFWMDRQGRSVQTDLEQDVQEAAGGGRWAVLSLAFVAVLREGIELALFLTAAAFTATAGATLVGALLGLAGAAVAGWLLFATTARLNVRSFFRLTSFLLILFAAGLVAHGVHELNEIGWIPPVVEPLWDLNPVLDEGSGLGQLLSALFGYNGNPSLTEVTAYVGYWAVVLLALLRGKKVAAIRRSDTPPKPARS